LSFVLPGLGQWYLGRRRVALLYAVPVLVATLLLALQLAEGLTVFAARLLEPSFSLALLILVVLLGAWRLQAMLDAALPRGRRSELGRGSGAALILMVAVVVGAHGVAAYYTYSFYQAGSTIFVGVEPDGDKDPIALPSGESPAPSDDYEVPPFATPPSEASRLTILLTGVDKSTDRTHALTDTLLVASLDPATGAVVMVSFPRDISQFPLYGGGTYSGKINSLMSYAASHPDEFPDGPLPTLASELGFLLGIPIHYFAAVDLDGFQRMIEAVDGVTVDLDRAIADPLYDWLDGSPPGFYLAAGRHRLDARTALAYVRSRQGIGDTDYTRADRQQQLLLALREKLTDPSNIDRVPTVLDAAAETIRTNFPSDRLDEMIGLAQDIDGAAIRRVVLQPPTYSRHPPTSSTGGTWTLRLRQDAVRRLSVELFGRDSAFWSGTFDPAGSPIPLATP
jgi:LCP family protein required for cell wall assembly